MGERQSKREHGTGADRQEGSAARVESRPIASAHAPRLGNRGMQRLLGVPRPVIQRKCAECSAGKTCPKCAAEDDEKIQRKAEDTAPAEPAKAPARGLIVDDDAERVEAGQMKKAAFLAALRTAVCKAAEESLAKTMWSSLGCPWIERWFAYYGGQDAAHIERAIVKYAENAQGVKSAAGYIPVIVARLKRGIEHWTRTGEVTGVPPEVAQQPPEAAGQAPAGARAAEKAVRFKSEGGAARPAAPSPTGVRDRLGAGSSLDSGVRGRMEGAFGTSFAQVRVHSDARGAEVSRDLGARALTVGQHVAFAPGEYQPGTPIGDALIAHELAHVVQQSSGAVQSERDELPFEEEADLAAVRAVSSLWGLAKTVAVPRLKSGLRLQRCPSKNEGEKKAPEAEKTTKVGPEIEATEESMGGHVKSCMLLANEGQTADTGIHYAENYKQRFPDRWKNEYWRGYADPYYFEHLKDSMDWRLLPRRSASAALKKWLKGLTIAECLSTAVAVQLETLRAAIGDKKFDERYGSADKDTPEKQRLRIRKGIADTPAADAMIVIDLAARGGPGTIGNRPAKLGEWYYFTNHPKYLLKHPAGAWQGENAIFLGVNADKKQIWSGLGATEVTEEQLLDEMVGAYNGARGVNDTERLELIKTANGGVLPKEYDAAGGVFPDTINRDQLLNDPPFEVKGKTRKGGFKPDSGKMLDPEKVKKLRE